MVCSSPCLTCNSTADNDCRTCIVNYYLSGTECISCDLGCEICSTTSDNCSSCLSKYYFTTENICAPCVYPCDTCLTETYCYTCGFDVDNRHPGPTCNCLHAYSNTGSSCVICTSPCYTCLSDSINECLTCIDKYYFDSAALIATPNCLACSSECTLCTSSDIC